LLSSSFAQAQQSGVPKRILVLYWYNKDFPGNVLFEQGFQAVLQSARLGNVEIYPEYLESNRFPGEAQSVFLRDYLRQKYADRYIDTVVAVTDASFDFLLKNRTVLFPHSPILFVAVKHPTADQLMAGPGITGIVPVSTHSKTLELALHLHPGTEQVFFVSGTLEHDKRFEIIARKELQGFDGRVPITYLTDLAPEELAVKTRSLPKRSIILYAWQQSLNKQGQVVESWELLSSISPSASAPIYGMGSVNVGRGLVGGYVASSEANGTRIAEIAVRILNGERAQDIPVEDAPAVLMFDWRELRRWGISEDRLPSGSIVRFKELTFWGRNKWRIIGLLTLIALQTSFITALLIERRRRQRSKDALDQLNTELEQRIAARTAALNNKSRELETFAYSVAHDLKAPLRGIDGYSRLLLEDYAESLNDEGRSFLETIQTSTEEMGQLIDDLLAYSRLERREFKPDRLELKPLITRLVGQKQRELADRNIDFVVDVNGGIVEADANGLIQSLGNYLDNAVKFTRQVPHPRIEVGSKVTATNCLLWVRDNGVGFDIKYHDRIFDIFQRLNPGEDYPGTGIGLAIVRKAMERMGGRAWAESQPGQGATFYLEIPKTNESEVDS
jgi:signal transduction histidine kinase